MKKSCVARLVVASGTTTRDPLPMATGLPD
jgi:hypothetical protein